MNLNLIGYMILIQNKKHNTIHIVLCEREEQVTLVKQAVNKRRRTLTILMDVGMGSWPNLMQQAILEYPKSRLASTHLWDDFLNDYHMI